MRDLMTAGDVNKRLGNCENPLELSIEKWEILVERWSEGADIIKDVDDYAIGSSTCALCQDRYRVTGGPARSIDEFCSECPYTLHYGQNCCESHFEDVEGAVYGYEGGRNSREDVVRTAQAMVDALKEIRDKTEPLARA